MKYKDYLSIAKNIFPNDAIDDREICISKKGRCLQIAGGMLLQTCDYTLLQYNSIEKVLYVPYKLVYTQIKIYPAIKDSNEEAYLIKQFRHIVNPTKKQFEEECCKLLAKIKELRIKEKLDNIQEDFQ